MTTETPEKDPREQAARLRELLAIPERQRSDAQWDEMIAIEIDLGPRKLTGNSPRQAAPEGRRQQAKRPDNAPVMVGKYPRSKHRPRQPG